LRYLVEETLTNRSDRLKGYSIALAVFGRNENFDPQSDPVVRLEARRLRRDLDGYYAGAGSHDRLRISIPRGGYIPFFEWVDGKPDLPPIRLDDPVAQPAVASSSLPRCAAGADAAASPLDRPQEPPRPAGKLPVRRRLAAIGLGAILLSFAFGAGAWFETRNREPETSPRAASVIVLPFEALSSGQDDRFLAAGLTQELVTDLLRFSAFRLSLPANTAGSGFIDPGRDVGGSYAVRGYLRSENGSVRVGVQLVKPGSGEVFWSETFDRQVSRSALLNVEGELASRIAGHLGQVLRHSRNGAPSEETPLSPGMVSRTMWQ
jgi:TolB-like protein